MSKGPGNQQRAFLQLLRERGEPVLAQEALWHHARAQNALQPASDPTLGKEVSAAFRSSYLRAVRGLATRGRVTRVTRRLIALPDLVRYYPFKATNETVLQMRHELLPFALEFAQRGRGTRFSGADNEIHMLGKLGAEATRGLQETWSAFEARILKAIRTVPERSQRALIGILVRGSQLFDPRSRVSHITPFVELANHLKEHVLGADLGLADDLVAFAEKTLPQEEYLRNRMKTRLYKVAALSESVRHPYLHEPFKQFLLQEAREKLERLPGHRTRTTHGGKFDIDDWIAPAAQFSPLLDQLILRDALGPFDFYTVAGTASGAPAAGAPEGLGGAARPSESAVREAAEPSEKFRPKACRHVPPFPVCAGMVNRRGRVCSNGQKERHNLAEAAGEGSQGTAMVEGEATVLPGTRPRRGMRSRSTSTYLGTRSPF